ncbi:hypothetical protein K456DRAFT_51079 [Colletotrichum gloeosporioides 23]|nr:hypothetical protein K456DRAFT_51079 [Colletotrichum gloeosporioides 23]
MALRVDACAWPADEMGYRGSGVENPEVCSRRDGREMKSNVGIIFVCRSVMFFWTMLA